MSLWFFSMCNICRLLIVRFLISRCSPWISIWPSISVSVRDMDPFTELYFLLQNPVGISYYKLIFSSYKNTKAVSLLFLCHLCLEIVLQDVYFRYAPQFHVSDSLSYSDTTF